MDTPCHWAPHPRDQRTHFLSLEDVASYRTTEKQSLFLPLGHQVRFRKLREHTDVQKELTWYLPGRPAQIFHPLWFYSDLQTPVYCQGMKGRNLKQKGGHTACDWVLCTTSPFAQPKPVTGNEGPHCVHRERRHLTKQGTKMFSRI